VSGRPLDRGPAGVGASAAGLVLALSATLTVYAGLLGCFFYADDIVLLYDARNDSALEFVLTPYGGHATWARNLVFLVLERLAGPNPKPFFAVALATHLVNVLLCFATVRAATGSAVLATVWATLWGTSPGNAATMSWFSVHGQMLVTTMLLVMLWRAAVLTTRGAEPSARDAWAMVVLSAVAAGTFGIGLGLGVALPVAALVVFPRLPWRRRLVFLSPLVLIPLLYVGALAAYAMIGWRSTAPSSETVLAGLPDAIALTALLVGAGFAGLVGGFTAWGPLPAPVVAGGVVVLVVLVASALVVADPPSRRRIVGVAMLAVAVYGVIALGRAPLAAAFGGVVPVANTPRYHYAGPLVLAVLAALVCAEARRLPRATRVGTVLAVLVLCIDAATYAGGRWRLTTHDWVRRLTNRDLATISAAAAKAAPGATVVVPNERYYGVGPLFVSVPTIFPRLAGAFIAFRDDDTVAGRHIRFAESDAEAYAQLTADPGRRIARLLVPGTPAP